MTGISRWQQGERHRTAAHALAGLAAAALAFGALILIEKPLRDEALARARLEAHAAASVPRVRLEQELSDTLALSHGLASLFALDGLPGEERFARLAAQAVRKSPHIRNIGLSQGTVIARIWPHEANAAALGMDYRDRPEQWPQVRRAMETGRPVLAGPVPLIQGGIGLIQRVPVVAAGEEEWSGAFLGMLGLVIDVDSVLRAAGFTDGAGDLRLGLRGGDGEMIWGDATVFDADPVLLDISLPGAEWQLAATPARGWVVGSPLFTLLRVLETAAALLIGGGVFGLLRHRHQRREAVARLSASEARLRDAQRIGGMGAFEWDSGSGTVWWSDELYGLFGWEPGSPVPLERMLTAVHPDDVDGLMAAVARASRPGGRLDHEYRLVRDDGTVRSVRSWGEAAASGTASGAGIRLRGLVLDVTERARADAERERLVTRLRRSNQELERFATIAAHDLQEPLRQIASPLQLLQRRYAGRLDADAETFIGYAVDGAKRMQRQILDLLDFSRVSTTPFAPAPVDLAVVLAEVRAALAAEEAAAEARVSVGPLPVVAGDRDQLATLLTHLLRNALRYRKPGEPAEVAVAAREEGAGVWHLTVADAGIGVPAAFHDRIFDIFRRLAPPDGSASGIGLAMCRRIAERHDGRIWIESAEGQGAVLHVLLPGASEAFISTAGAAPMETA